VADLSALFNPADIATASDAASSALVLGATTSDAASSALVLASDVSSKVAARTDQSVKSAASPSFVFPTANNEVIATRKLCSIEDSVQQGFLLGIQDSIGLTWTDLGQQYSQTEIDGICYLGNGIVVAGTGPNGKILRSTDYGLTWTDLGQQYSQTYIDSLCYLGNGIILAGTAEDGKILRSTDYGLTWTDLGQQYSQEHLYRFCYLGNGIALAGTSPNGKILRSTNYGLTWTDLGQQYSQTYVVSLCYLGNGIVLAGTCLSGKILRSTDYGLTWTDLGQQYSQTWLYSLHYLGNGIVLAGTVPGGKILRSVNADPVPAGLTTTGIINASAGKVRVTDNNTTLPSGESDGYVGTAFIGGNGRLYFVVGEKMYYIDGTEVVPPAGSSTGLLLAITYS